MTKLLDHAAQACKGRGISRLILVPGSRDLFRFYEKRGYRTAFYLQKASLKNSAPLDGPASSSETLSAGQMLAARRAVLRGRTFVDWEERALEHVLKETRMQGGQIIAASDGDRQGYALCLPSEQQVFVSEWIAPPELFDHLASAVQKAYPGKEILLRTAPGLLPDKMDRETVPFGMACPLGSAPAEIGPDAYLGLPMD